MINSCIFVLKHQMRELFWQSFLNLSKATLDFQYAKFVAQINKILTQKVQSNKQKGNPLNLAH